MSSTDDDDDNLELFREAVDKDFINDSMFNGSRKEVDKKLNKPSSLRHRKNVEDEQKDFIKLTPEFRNYVGKKLEQLLDKEIVYKTFTDINMEKKKKKSKDNVRLFRNSTHRLKITVDTQYDPVIRRAAKRVASPDIDDLKSVAVSGEDILNKKGTEYWSNRSKAAVFHYRRDKNGCLTCVEPSFK